MYNNHAKRGQQYPHWFWGQFGICIIITRNGDSMDTLTDSEVSLTHTLQLYFKILSHCFDFIFVVPEQYFRGGQAIFSLTFFRYLLFSKRPFPLRAFFKIPKRLNRCAHGWVYQADYPTPFLATMNVRLVERRWPPSPLSTLPFPIHSQSKWRVGWLVGGYLPHPIPPHSSLPSN